MTIDSASITIIMITVITAAAILILLPLGKREGNRGAL
jgi:hypothetical protein